MVILMYGKEDTSFAAVANATYAADRFFYEKTGAMVHTITRDADVPTQAQSGLKSLYSIEGRLYYSRCINSCWRFL